MKYIRKSQDNFLLFRVEFDERFKSEYSLVKTKNVTTVYGNILPSTKQCCTQRRSSQTLSYSTYFFSAYLTFDQNKLRA